MKVTYKKQVTEFFADSENTAIKIAGGGGPTGRTLRNLSNIIENISE